MEGKILAWQKIIREIKGESVMWIQGYTITSICNVGSAQFWANIIMSGEIDIQENWVLLLAVYGGFSQGHGTTVRANEHNWGASSGGKRTHGLPSTPCVTLMKSIAIDLDFTLVIGPAAIHCPLVWPLSAAATKFPFRTSCVVPFFLPSTNVIVINPCHYFKSCHKNPIFSHVYFEAN